jgi:hypothetical protein
MKVQVVLVRLMQSRGSVEMSVLTGLSVALVKRAAEELAGLMNETVPILLEKGVLDFAKTC